MSICNKINLPCIYSNVTNTTFEGYMNEDLRKWFKEKWVDISRTNDDGSHPSCGASSGSKARGKGSRAYPKCVKKSKANTMSDKEKKSATRRKRNVYKGDGDPPKKAKNVNTDSKKEAFIREMVRHYIRQELLHEANIPTNPSLWKKAIAKAKAKFDVYPSAYANGWAAKWYKSQGGGWKKGKKKK